MSTYSAFKTTEESLLLPTLKSLPASTPKLLSGKSGFSLEPWEACRIYRSTCNVVVVSAWTILRQVHVNSTSPQLEPLLLKKGFGTMDLETFSEAYPYPYLCKLMVYLANLLIRTLMDPELLESGELLCFRPPARAAGTQSLSIKIFPAFKELKV